MTHDEQAIITLCRSIGARLIKRAPIEAQYEAWRRGFRGTHQPPFSDEVIAPGIRYQEQLGTYPDITDAERELLMAFARGESVLQAKLGAVS